MPVFTSSEEWQQQSSLLIRAQPRTTRITTKYNIPNLSSERHLKKQRLRAKKKSSTTESDIQPDPASKDAAAATTTTDTKAAAAAPPPDGKTPKASFELKTYDPVTGVTLKYRTDKAAEVSRLIAASGRLARDMLGLPPQEDKVVSPSDVAAAAAVEVKDAASAVAGQVVGTAKTVAAAAVAKTGATAESGKKKKKKGKK